MCTGSERKFCIYTFSQSVKNAAQLIGQLCCEYQVASSNSSWIIVHIHTPTAAEIDPVMALLIRKAESIRHIVGDQWEWELN